MKHLLKVLLILVLCVSTVLSFTACKEDDENVSNVKSYTYGTFGEFSYNGETLTDYAVKAITAGEAKTIVDNNAVARHTLYSTSGNSGNSLFVALTTSTYSVAADGYIPSVDIVNSVLEKYSGCVLTTNYFIEGKDKKVNKVDRIIGTDFKNMLLQNQFTPFSQLVARNVVVFTDMIDYMEAKNEEFRNSETGYIAPFRNIFTYHEDANGNLIIQTRDFAEIASSVGGGIGSSYRQDTEIVYDEECKMVQWQTSLGLTTSTPQGTLQQGFILDVQVSWIAKD